MSKRITWAISITTQENNIWIIAYLQYTPIKAKSKQLAAYYLKPVLGSLLFSRQGVLLTVTLEYHEMIYMASLGSIETTYSQLRVMWSREECWHYYLKLGKKYMLGDLVNYTFKWAPWAQMNREEQQASIQSETYPWDLKNCSNMGSVLSLCATVFATWKIEKDLEA